MTESGHVPATYEARLKPTRVFETFERDTGVAGPLFCTYEEAVRSIAARGRERFDIRQVEKTVVFLLRIDAPDEDSADEIVGIYADYARAATNLVPGLCIEVWEVE